MKKGKRFLSILLATLMLPTAMAPMAGMTASAAGTTIVDMRVEDLQNPLGIDAEHPVFSWKMQSDSIGQCQTAYRIVVATDDSFTDTVWDSGKVSDDRSVGIAYAGNTLQSSTKYYWQVSVWDKDGKEIKSEAATFEMGLLGEDAWDGSSWIQLGTSTTPPVDGDITEYTVEADVQVENTCVALVFQAKDKQNFLMWQVSVSGGKLMLNPHYNRNGYAVIRNVDVTDKAVGAITGVQHLKVVVNADGVTTYLNDQLVDTLSPSALGGQGFAGKIGYIGYRAHSDANERGWMDNITVTDQDGNVIKQYDFNDGGNPMDGGEVVNGRLHAVHAGGETIVLEGSAAADAQPIHYTVEADVTVTGNALGLLFNAVDSGNFYMMQLNTVDQGGKVLFKPHTWAGGNYATYSGHTKDVTAVTGSPNTIKTTPVKVKIDVTESRITTYLNGSQVDVTGISEIGSKGPAPQIAALGLRAESGEGGTIDNFKLIDLTDSAEGEVVYNYTFEEENPYLGGKIENGKFIANATGVLMPITHSGVATFRKELTPAKSVASAKLYAAGLGVYDLFIDGQRVGHLQADGSYIYDELKPGYTHHSKRTHYYTYDVSHMFKAGQTSTLSAHVTSGWWSGGMTSHYGKNEALRLKLLLTYTDGTTEWICTDRTWKTSRTGPILYSDIYNGETYNANADLSFRQSGYDDKKWTYADVNTEFAGTICAVVGPAIRVREDLELATKSATVYSGVIGAGSDRYGKINITGTYEGEAFTLKAGETAVIDLGQNFAGWDEITVEGERGTVVTMRHGEMLNDNEGLRARGNDGPEGSIYTANLRTAKATGKYILSGEGVETYHSTTTFYGFRYLEITTTKDITVHGVKGIVVTSVAEDTGSISTSNQLVNQLISNIVWGQYSNYLSVPTDCPQRDERKGWTADAQVFSTAASYIADSKGFLRKYMYDMMDSQVTSGYYNGAYPDTAPYNGYGEIGQLGWGDAGVIIPYNLYKMYGDVRIVEENWDAMQKFMDIFMASTNKMGGGHNHGDWLAYESNDNDIQNLFGVAYYAWDAQMMAEMAEVLGKTAEAERYRALYEDEKAHFQNLFVLPDGSLKRTEQTACLMALKFDLLPDENSVEKVKQALLDNINRNGVKLQTGFLGTAILMQTLSDIGETETAYQLLLQRGNPSWLYSVDQGATTIWERWNSYTIETGFGDVSMNSFNHYAYGAVAEWMYGYMAGILYDVSDPGFKNILLQPNPDPSISHVDCSYASAYGEIVSNWKYEGGQLVYDMTVPANTTATISIPVEAGAALLVNGKAAASVSKDADGLEYIETADGKAVFQAVAGTYHFTTDVTEYCYITLESDMDAMISVDGGDMQAMPNGIALEKGKEVTLTAKPKNDADYITTGWTGDLTANSATITFTPEEDMTLKPVFEWANGDSLALNKTVTSSNGWETGSWSSACLVDGVIVSNTGKPGYTTRPTGGKDVSLWVEIDLGENMAFDRIQLYPRSDSTSISGGLPNFPVNFTLQVKADGASTYTTVAEYTDYKGTVGRPMVAHIDTVTARYVRLNVTKLSDAASADSGNNYLQLCEMSIYNDVEHVGSRIEALPAVDAITAENAADTLKAATTVKALYDALPANKQAKIDGAAHIDAVIEAAEALLTPVEPDPKPEPEPDPKPEPDPILMGDVDKSGSVDVADIMKLKALIMADKWSDEELTIGDLNDSKALDVGDIMAVKNIIMSA